MKVSRFRELLDKTAASLDPEMAAELRAFSRALAAHDSLEVQALASKLIPRAKKPKGTVKESGSTLKRKRGAPEAMIREYLKQLEEAYPSDDSFESVVRQIEDDKGVTKADVQKIFNEVFKSDREFPDKRTKAQRIEDLRRERLNRIRFDAA